MCGDLDGCHLERRAVLIRRIAIVTVLSFDSAWGITEKLDHAELTKFCERCEVGEFDAAMLELRVRSI